jgi:transcriptional regulator of arginine metabolism
VLTDTQQHDRRSAIVRILRAGFVRKQEDLVRLLKKEGHEVTQSSVSRDLRDMGVLKASGRYVLPPDDLARPNGEFGTLAQFAGTISGDDTIFIATVNSRAQDELLSRLQSIFRLT